MNNQKYYRYPWTKEKVEILLNHWPHFGTYGIFHLLPDITRKQVKAKVNKLGLKLLPKTERLCISCKKNKQHSRKYGLQCKECSLSKRRDIRSSHLYTFEEWMKEIARNCRYRSVKLHGTNSDVTAEYLKELWNKQIGKCYYSKIDMIIPEFKRERSPFTASIDRKNSSLAYTKENIVWCCWGCNCGKNNFSMTDYLKICRAVVDQNPE